MDEAFPKKKDDNKNGNDKKSSVNIKQKDCENTGNTSVSKESFAKTSHIIHTAWVFTCKIVICTNTAECKSAHNF